MSIGLRIILLNNLCWFLFYSLSKYFSKYICNDTEKLIDNSSQTHFTKDDTVFFISWAAMFYLGL